MMQPARVEISRDHQPEGGSLPLRESVEIYPTKKGQTVPDAVEEWIRPLQPSRTSQNCVYAFDSPELGRGVLTVNIQGSMYGDRLDDKVQLLEIERALGQRQPARLVDSPVWQYGIRLHVRNPYLQVLFGLVFVCGGLAPFLIPSSEPEGLSDAPFLILGALAILLGSYYWVFRGLRRFSWWHRARGEVKRGGEKMPEDLQLFS